MSAETGGLEENVRVPPSAAVDHGAIRRQAAVALSAHAVPADQRLRAVDVPDLPPLEVERALVPAGHDVAPRAVRPDHVDVRGVEVGRGEVVGHDDVGKLGRLRAQPDLRALALPLHPCPVDVLRGARERVALLQRDLHGRPVHEPLQPRRGCGLSLSLAGEQRGVGWDARAGPNRSGEQHGSSELS